MCKKVRVIRDVSKQETHNFSQRDVLEGETLFVFQSLTYGTIDWENGIALSERGCHSYPFFEFPRNAVEELST